jgi:hypothetical protein
MDTYSISYIGYTHTHIYSIDSVPLENSDLYSELCEESWMMLYLKNIPNHWINLPICKRVENGLKRKFNLPFP